MSKMDPGSQTPLDSTKRPTSTDINKAAQTLDLDTVGSENIGLEHRLGFLEWIYLTLDRECTPVLYVYFAGIAILAVITTGIVIIVGLQCNWDFVAVD